MTARGEMNFDSAKSLEEDAPSSDTLIGEAVAEVGAPEPLSDKAAGKNVSSASRATADEAFPISSANEPTVKAPAVSRKIAAANSAKLPRQKVRTGKSPAPRSAQQKTKSEVVEVPVAPAKTAKLSPLSRMKALAKTRAMKVKSAAATVPAHRLGDIIDPPALPAAKTKVTAKVEKAVEIGRAHV